MTKKIFKFEDFGQSWLVYFLSPIGHKYFPEHIGFDGQFFYRKKQTR